MWTDATHFNGKSITGKTSSPRLKNAQYGFKWGVWTDGPGRHNNCGVIGLESIIIRFAPRRRDMVCLLAARIHHRRRAVSLYNKRSCTIAPANSLTPPPPSTCSAPFLLCLSKIHFNLHSVQSSRLVIRVQVLIALWCNVIHPLYSTATNTVLPSPRSEWKRGSR